MEITDKDVLEKFISKDRVNSARAAKKHIEKNYPEYCVYLKNRFSEDEFISYAKTIRRIYDNVEVLPVCQNCGKKLLDYTHKWCSTSCQLSDRKFIEKRVEESRPFLKERAQKGKRTCLERYGVECIFNRSEVREKTKKGVVSEEAKQKRKQTNLEKYGSENVFACKDIREKIKETNIKKYGVSVPIQNQEIKEKIIKTNQDKFGSDFYLGTKQCIEKTREFNQNKYGVDWFSKTDVYKEQFRETCLERFGVDNPGKLENTIVQSHSKESNFKRNETKRKNKTFNTSRPEEECYNILCNCFGKECVLRQYRSEMYPFNCDFYIKNVDLYIEFQGHWTHGPHPYSDLEEDQILLNKWKSKNNDFYNLAIKVWTESDPKKRSHAKDNNLNWFEFWSIDEIKTFIMNYGRSNLRTE